VLKESLKVSHEPDAPRHDEQLFARPKPEQTPVKTDIDAVPRRDMLVKYWHESSRYEGSKTLPAGVGYELENVKQMLVTPIALPMLS